MRRGQGAFEYILLLAGVLLIVVLAIIILRGAVPGTQVNLAQCKAQVAAVSSCVDNTGAWDFDGCGATGCLYAQTGVSSGCEATFAGTPWDDGDGATAGWGHASDTTNEVTAFDCGLKPV